MREQQGASRIVSVGYYLPETRVRTAEMLDAARASRFGVTNNFIEDTMGIREVRHAASDQRPSDLAVAAAEQALAKTDINPDEIDLIIFCGIEGDYAEPSTAHIVQAALGLSGICFDVSNACLGFMSGMQIANDMIKGGSVRHALVCTGEKTSNLSNCVIDEFRTHSCSETFEKKLGFLSVGDGGGAIILGKKTSDDGIISIHTASEGQFSSLCHFKYKNNIAVGQMIMGRICSLTAKLHLSVYKTALESLSWDPSDISCLITHQVGLRPYKLASKAFCVGLEKMTKTFDLLGNLTTATFPVNLAIAQEHGTLNKSDNIFAAMSGSGISVSHIGLRL